MAKAKHGWDWGRFDPARCGEFVVGAKMVGGKFTVNSCHRTKAAARKALRAQARAVSSVKGLLVQLRDKSSGKILTEKSIAAKPKKKRAKKTKKARKGPMGLIDRFRW